LPPPQGTNNIFLRKVLTLYMTVMYYIYTNPIKRSVKIMTNITVRIDDDVKRDAEALFGKLGLSISGAINVFFRQAIREQAIPFRVRAVSEYDEYFNERNMERLRESIAQAESGQVIVKTMAELEAMENE
jgi:DNA-damage-inducible protein J